jgi:hypothetical protein
MNNESVITMAATETEVLVGAEKLVAMTSRQQTMAMAAAIVMATLMAVSTATLMTMAAAEK